jgi:hypothetical protein
LSWSTLVLPLLNLIVAMLGICCTAEAVILKLNLPSLTKNGSLLNDVIACLRVVYSNGSSLVSYLDQICHYMYRILFLKYIRGIFDLTFFILLQMSLVKQSRNM